MKTRKIKNTTDRKIYNSLYRWFNAATNEQVEHGLAWYDEAQQLVKQLASEYDIDSYQVAAVVSALSPNNKWNRNKQDAVNIIHAHCNGADPMKIKVCTYNANKIKAIGILQGNTELVSKSAKTHSFAMNIGLLSDAHVTVDKWHMRACLISPKEGKRPIIENPTPAQYRRIEAITVKLAKELNLKAYELQAIIWVTIRSNWGFGNA